MNVCGTFWCDGSGIKGNNPWFVRLHRNCNSVNNLVWYSKLTNSFEISLALFYISTTTVSTLRNSGAVLLSFFVEASVIHVHVERDSLWKYAGNKISYRYVQRNFAFDFRQNSQNFLFSRPVWAVTCFALNRRCPFACHWLKNCTQSCLTSPQFF